MADRNSPDLDREQRGSSNPNQMERPEDRNTSSTETGMGGSKGSQHRGGNQGVGNETGDRTEGDLGSNRDGNRSSGNMEGDENLDRR